MKIATVLTTAFGVLAVAGLGTNARAMSMTFNWSGVAIQGEDPNVLPSGTATFEVTGSTLKLTLTNTTSGITAIGQVLTGLTWDMTAGIVLDPVSAVLGSTTVLVGAGATTATDVSGEWFFKDNISAGDSIGSFGVGTMGDINFGADTFGVFDAFGGTNLFGPAGPNGIEVGVLGTDVDFSGGGFQNQGPLAQGENNTPGQIVFTWNLTSGSLDPESDITNVRPLFGTDGALVLVPEPSGALLAGIALLFVGLRSRGRR